VRGRGGNAGVSLVQEIHRDHQSSGGIRVLRSDNGIRDLTGALFVASWAFGPLGPEDVAAALETRKLDAGYRPMNDWLL